MQRPSSEHDPLNLDRIHEQFATKMRLEAQASMEDPLPPAAVLAVDRSLRAGRREPFGDGDQNVVSNPNHNPLRVAWSTGLDCFEATLHPDSPPLHRICFFGDPSLATRAVALERIAHPNNENIVSETIERRLSKMRLTPLHYACQGARMIASQNENNEYPCRYEEVIRVLIDFGARVDSRDIAGYTPLSILIGVGANSHTISLIQMLVGAGADPNAMTRFREPILQQAVMNHNFDAFKAMLRAGARVEVSDSNGLTTERMIMSSPVFKRAVADVLRELGNKCDQCGATNAEKLCSGCKSARYCNQECQRVDWRSGHKQKCKELREKRKELIMDVVVNKMTLDTAIPLSFLNNITGVSSTTRMRKRNVGETFVVKVYPTPNVPVNNAGGLVDAVKISEQNNDFTLLSGDGDGKQVFERLTDVVKKQGRSMGKVYLAAHWTDAEDDTLRIDTSSCLPPPAPLW